MSTTLLFLNLYKKKADYLMVICLAILLEIRILIHWLIQHSSQKIVVRHHWLYRVVSSKKCHNTYWFQKEAISSMTFKYSWKKKKLTFKISKESAAFLLSADILPLECWPSSIDTLTFSNKPSSVCRCYNQKKLMQ